MEVDVEDKRTLSGAGAQAPSGRSQALEPAAATTRPVLVLYAPADEPFVRGYLLPAIDPAPEAPRPTGNPVAAPAPRDPAPVIEARDLSTIAIPELEQLLRRSGTVIVVVTPALLTNPWARLSELLATSAAIESDLDVIPLWLEDCTLPLHLEAKVHLDFRSRAAWDHEAAHLRRSLARPAPADPPLLCPYPGMRPFDAADARFFHGRDAEIKAVIALVAAGEREIYLVGPSGSGKSSLIAAGVLPQLAAQPGAPELVLRTMRPGDAPLRRLADCLDAGPTAAPAAGPTAAPGAGPTSAPGAGPTTAPGTGPTSAPGAAAIAAWSARHPAARLVVFVDQLEELFTLAAPAQQAGFATALAQLRAEPRCLLVLAVRADFYAELMQSQLWLDGARRHVDLPPLRGPALRAAIELPARALDVYLEPGLIDRLLADAAGEPGVLPLLQETLVQLWGRRHRRLLTRADYDALGEAGRSGLAVAISSRADACLRDMTPAQVTLARRLLLRLVSFGEGRPDTRRRQTRAQLFAGEPPAELDAVLRQLVAARLVTMTGDGDSAGDGARGGDGHRAAQQVDLCHEVLITAWPSFAAWVDTRRADEQRRRQIHASAEDWVTRGRGASGLLDDGELAAALAWRRTDAVRELGESPEVTALVDASRDALARARARGRRRLAAVVAGLLVFAGVTTTLAVIARGQAGVAEAQRAKAEVERQNAVHQLGEQYREVGRQAVVAGQLQRALPYLVAAREQGVDDPGLRMMFRTATMSSVAASLHHDGPVTAASFSADGTRIVTASLDRTARVWDAASGAPVTPPLVHPRPVTAAAIQADGARIVTVSDDNTAWIWEVTPGPPPPIALHHTDTINTASFSADGAVVVTASNDKTVRLWDARTGALRAPPLVHDAWVASAALSRDGSRVVTTVGDGLTAGIWNAKTGALIAPLRKDFWSGAAEASPSAHLDLVLGAAFSPDGARVVTAGADNTALVWDAATGKVVGQPLAHKDGVSGAAFSPDGARVATAGDDNRVRIWDVATGAVVGPVLEHPSRVLDVAWSRDGTRLLAQSDDKIVRLWDVASGSLVTAIDLESGAMAAALGPDGARVVTASTDGLARIWDVRSQAPRVIDREPRIFDAAFSPDGARIATSAVTGMHIWAASGALEATLNPLLGVTSVVFDRDGRRLAAIALDGTARIAEVAPARLHAEPREPAGPSESSIVPGQLIGHTAPRAAWSPDGRRYATTGGARSAQVWDTESGRVVTPPLVHDAAVVMVRFSPDGGRVVTASKDGTARVWDASSGAPIGPPLIHPTDSWVTGATFSPDGKRIVTVCTDHDLRLWDAASSRLETVLAGHAGWIISAVFSSDGALILSNSEDHSARIWDVATGKLAAPPLEHPNRVESAAFSPDGKRVVTTSDKLAQVWDVETGRPLTPPFVHPDYLRAALFSPDGTQVLTVDLNAVRLWDAGLDNRTLEDWRHITADSAFPQLREAMKRVAPASHATR